MSAEPQDRRLAVWPLFVVAAGLLAFYLWIYPIFDVRVGLGSDTPVYVWWSRYAGAAGFGPFRTGTRPGIIGIIATLSRLTGAPQALIAPALAPTLAVAAGFAMAAFTQVALGGDRRLRFALTALFTGAFLALMVDGYLSTLAFATAFLAGAACLSAALPEADRVVRGVAAAALLWAAAATCEPQLLPTGIGILVGGAIALVPSFRRARAAGAAWTETGLGRLGIATGGAAVAGGAAFLTSGPSAPDTRIIDTSRDSVLRRTGLPELLQRSYRGVLHRYFPPYRGVVFALLPLSALIGAPRPWRTAWARADDRGRFLTGAFAIWIAGSLLGVLALLAGLAVAGQRLAAFCLPVPVLAAVGLTRAWDRGVARGSAGRRLLSTAGMALFVLTCLAAWLGERPQVTPAVVSQARSAAEALAAQPSGTPLIVVMDRGGDRPALWVTRYANYVMDAVPARRVPDVYFAIASPSGFLAGRPSLTGRAEHDRMSTLYWKTLRPELRRRPLAVVVRAFDPAGYRAATALPGSRRIAPGVVALPGHLGPDPGAAATLGVGPGPLPPWTFVAASAGLLALLGLAGWAWALAVLPEAGTATRFALSPAMGFASLALASVLVDAAGVRLSDAGGYLATALVVAAGLFAAARR